jgi:predicted HTH domain antitoxin
MRRKYLGNKDCLADHQLTRNQGIAMQTIQVQLPDTVNIDAQEIQMLLAGKLYEKGVLSVGQAAQMAGFSKRAFMELLGHYQVSVLNYPANDILQDFENA